MQVDIRIIKKIKRYKTLNYVKMHLKFYRSVSQYHFNTNHVQYRLVTIMSFHFVY